MQTRSILAYVAAGAAAVGVRFGVLAVWAGGNSEFGDPEILRLAVAAVFFAVLVGVDREAFTGMRSKAAQVFSPADFAPGRPVTAVSDSMAKVFSGVTDDASRQAAVREWLTGIPAVVLLIPLLFYLRFGMVGDLGWGLTVFFAVYCVLWAVGLYFRPKTEYHTTVAAKGDWVDWVGAFWLVACAFGPLFGWAVTEGWTMTPESWHWRYVTRVVLAAGLPVVTGLPMFRYIKGKSAQVALPMLVLVTLLPVLTAVHAIQDLVDGPVPRGRDAVLVLAHTERALDERVGGGGGK